MFLEMTVFLNTQIMDDYCISLNRLFLCTMKFAWMWYWLPVAELK